MCIRDRTIATALKAGVDAMSDDPRMVEQAAREAYELGILKEEDMDRSIRCMMETKLRLGVYDRENLNPYDLSLIHIYSKTVCSHRH